MIEAASGVSAFQADFSRLEKDFPGATGGIGALRRRAMLRFMQAGFPTTRDEEWLFTDVRPIASRRFLPAGDAGTDPARLPDRGAWLSLSPFRIVFLNGRYLPELSSRAFPAGVRVASLAERIGSDVTSVEGRIDSCAVSVATPFAALNTAFFADGALIEADAKAVAAEPIHVIFATDSARPVAVHPRLLVRAGERSRLTLVESHIGTGVYFSNVVAEIDLAEGAVVEHVRLQDESPDAFHVAVTAVREARGSDYASHAIALGGRLSRHDLAVLLDGEGASCVANGLYLVDGARHVDNHTSIDHARPHCASLELYKGILDGNSSGVFNGKIGVRKDAQKSDARQTNRNLLLSEDAVINTKPQLEINADDVKCSHGATIGQLDDDALFYLRARGLSTGDARGLLIGGFAGEIPERIRCAPVRKALSTVLGGRLPGSLAAGMSLAGDVA